MTKATEHSSWAEYKKSRKKANASSGHPVSASTQATKATGVPGTWSEYKAARQSGQIERGVQPQSSIQERIRSALKEGATSPVSSRNVGAGENILPSTKRVGAGESVRGYVGQGEYAAQMMPEDFVGPLNERQTRRDVARTEEYMRNAREKRSVAEELFQKYGKESINAALPETSMPAEYKQTSAARMTAELGLPDFNQPRGQMQLMQDPYSAPVSGGIAPGQVLTQRAGITPEMTRGKQQGLRVGAGEAVMMDPVEIGYENLSAQPDFAEYAAKGAQERPITVPTDHEEYAWQAFENEGGIEDAAMRAHMTPEQTDTYNYLLGKYGNAEAEKYYRDIEGEVNQRMGESLYESMPSAVMPVVAGWDQMASGVRTLGDLVSGDTMGRATTAIQYADEKLAERLDSESGWEIPFTNIGWKRALHDTVKTITAQAPSMLLSYGGMGMAAKGLLDLSAFAGTYNQMRTEGASFGQALAGGIASAAIEDVTERIGGFAFGKDATLVRKLLGNNLANIANPIQRALVYTGLDATGEGLEEAIAGVAEPIVQEYILSPEEDERTFVEKLADAWNGIDWADVRYQGVLGAASGGVMTTAPNIAQVNAEQQRKAIEGAAQSIKSAETTPEQKRGAAAAALEAGGVMKEAAQEIADSVVKMANGQTVTQDELQMIAETPGALEVVETVVGAETDFDVDNYDDIEVPEDVADVDAYVNRERAVRNAVQLGSERAISEEIYDMGENQDAAQYTAEYERAYNRGRNNLPMSDDIAGTYKTLTAEQTRAAWNEGSKAYRAEQQRKPVQAAESMNGRKGYIDTSAIKNTRLTADQNSAVRASRYVAEALGIKVVWYASDANAEGKRTEANGFFDPKDRSIHLDVYAGVNTAENAGAYRYAAMRTFSHELTHYIEDQSPAMYGKLRDMVFAHLAGKGIDVESLIDEKAQRSPGISRFEATQEVVADACEMMLRDSKAVKAAAMRDASLWQKIKERFAKFVEDLRVAFERVEAVHKEAKGLMQDVEGVLKYTEELQKAWDEALVDATRNARSAGRDTNVRSKAAEQTNREIERIEEKGGSLVLSKEKADALNKKAKGKAGVTIVGDTLPTVQGRRQRAFLEALGREYGIEFVVHPTIDKGALNGVYISGNRIHLAADNLESGLMQTGIHETVHLIRAAEGEGYTELLDSVRGALGTDFDWDGTVAARAETDGLDLDAAEEEVLAEAVSAIYTNESAMRAFVMKHQSLAQRLIDGLRNFVAKMREIAERIYGRTGHEEINAMINATDEAVQKAADAYERALAEWKERAKAINYEGREPKATTPKANKSTLSTWAMALRQSAEKTGNPEVVARTEQAIANVQDFVDKAKEDSLAWKYLSSGTLNPYAPKGRSEGLGPLRTNVEYIYSFDPDTSCFRADGYIKIRDNIQRRMGRKMTARETQNLIQLMTAYGQMIPCRYCYVYGKRYMLDSAYNKKIVEKLGEGGVKTVFKAAESARRQIFEYLDEHYDVNNRYTLDEEMQVREFVLPTKRKKVRGVEKEVMMTPDDFIRDLRRHFKLESRRNLNTFLKGMVGEWLDDVFNGTSHNYDELADYVEMDTETLDIHATAVAGAQGGVKANKAKKYIPYDHQLDRIADDDMWNIIAHDGIRFQSSTDFRIEYVLDYMQLIAQMATYDKDLLVGATPVLAKNGMRTGKFVPGTGRIEHVSGLPGHMYAKNPDAAYILAPSGLHINASVAFDGDRLGQIKENTAEGMPMEDVAKLVKKYDNVGGMAMVTNPAQLAHAMKLVREGKLHQIIPFHASGLAREYYYDMMAWQDYTSVQNESLYTSSYCAEQLRKAGKEPAGTAEEIFKQYEDMFGEAEKLYVRNPKTGAYIRKAPHFLPGESVFEGVDPETGEAKVTRIPGHNNDYDTYLRLCKEWQVNPRFYEVEIPTEDGGTMKAIDDKVGYMALIYESRPGTKKAPVTADFDIEYALDQLSKRAAQDDKYAQGYLAAYEQGTDREDAIRRGQRYEKANVYDPMAIEERFFSEGLHEDDKHDKGLLTPDVVAMRESNGIKIDPKKNLQLSEEAKEVYDAYWSKDTEGVRYQPREEEYVSNREILANALEGTARSVAEKNRLAEYRMRIRSLDIAQNRVSNIREEITEVNRMIKEAKGAEKKQLIERLENLQAQMNTLEREMNETDKVLLKLEATEPLKLVVNRERKAAMDKVRSRAEDSRSRDKYRERIAKKVAALTVQLTKPTTKKYIPDPIRGPVADFVSSVRFTSQRQLKGGAPTQKDMKLADSLAALQRVMLNIKNKQNENTADAVQNGFGMYLDLPEGFIQTLTTLADQVAKAAQHSPEGYNVSMMSTAQLKALDAIITSLNASIQNVNKFLSENLYRHIDDAARDTIWDLEQIRAREKSTKIGQFLEWENALPVYAFDRLGRGGQAIFKGLMRGQDKLAQNADQVIKYAESVYDEEELKAWEEDVREFTFDEETIRIPVAHIMSLYCLMKREQAMGHLHGEGFRVGDYTIKGTTYKDKGHVTSDKMMAEIVSVLSDRQKMVADKLQNYMSTVGAEWGNYVSMRRFGYQAFGEITYFPIESDSRHLSAVSEDGGKGNPLYALLNIGPVQELTPKANNRLVLHSIFDVYSKHMSEMAQYNALALPLLDAIKWLNYRETTNLPGDEKATKRTLSIQDVIVNAYGMQGRGYVIRMLEDISGRKATVDEDKTFGKMLGRMNRAQVAFNLRVALLQPLSIFRAAMTLNAVPTMQGVLKNFRNLQDNIEEMEQYSGIAKWKALGFREVNVSRGVQKLIKHDYKATDKIVEKSMAAAEAMDKLTWSAIWEVCKIQTAKSMNPNDERYMEAVRDLFEETIYRTQVVDSVLTKTQYMRSPAGMNKWLSSFMSEPSTTYNMLADAVWKVADDARVSNVQEALRKNAPRIGRTVGVYAMSAVATTLIEGIMSAWRDDDDYEKFTEQMFDGFWWNLFENMNPLSMLPIGSQLWEGMKMVLENRGFDVYGYDMSNPINETFQSVIGIFDAWDRYSKGSGTGYNVLYKSGQMLSSLSGLPFANAMREVTSLWNNAIASWNPQLRIQTYKTPDAKGTAAYIKAVRSSNDRLAAEMIEEMEANGVTGEAREKAMTSAIKEAYLSGGMDDKEAARMLEKHAGYADTADDKMAAERLVREWTVKNETGESSQYARVWGYISDWDGRALLKEINELRKMGVKDSSIRSSVQSHFKGIYLEATGSEKSKLRQHLIAAFTYMGMTDKEAKAKIDEWDKQNRN